MRKKELIEKNNILLEQKMLLEKIGVEGLVNDLTLKIDMLTKKVNNGENLEKELQKNVDKLTSLLNNDVLGETELVEAVSNNIRNVLFAAFLALGMTNSQAQQKVNTVTNITSTNKSADVELSDEIKMKISKTIDGYFIKNKDVKQIVIEIIGKASQVTPPAGFTNKDLAYKRAEEANDFIEAKYGNKVIISNIETEIGKTKYVRGVDTKDDEKFKQEQGVTVNIKASFGPVLKGKFSSLTVIPEKNPDNLVIYNIKGDLVTSTGFFGSGTEYHPHYILSVTMSIVNNKYLEKYNKKFDGTLDELKALLTQPISKNDTYYNNALKALIERYKNNKPIYLYDLLDKKTIDLTNEGTVKIKVITNDKDTGGSITFIDLNNKTIKGVYNSNGFSFYSL